MKFIEKYNIFSFFLFTYLLSWISWIAAYMLFPDNTLFQMPLMRIGAFSPALISIFFCSAKGSADSDLTKKRWMTFFIVWIIACIHFYFYLTDIEGIESGIALIVIAVTTSLLPAFVLSNVFSKNKGIREHLSTIFYPAGEWIWHLIAFLIIPFILGLDILINDFLGNQTGNAEYTIQNHTILEFIWIFILIIVVQSLQAGGLSEEPGWRGYAQKRLQKKYPPLLAGIIIGLCWGIWHFPVYIPQLSNLSIWAILYGCLQIGLMFTWIYNRTQGSLLAVIVLHASWNTFTKFIPKTYIFDIIIGCILVIIIFTDKMWLPARKEVKK